MDGRGTNLRIEEDGREPIRIAQNHNARSRGTSDERHVRARMREVGIGAEVIAEVVLNQDPRYTGPHGDGPRAAPYPVAARTASSFRDEKVVEVDERSDIPVTGRVAAAIGELVGDDLPVAIECYDGSRIGPRDASTRLVVRSPDALRYLIAAPGELGFGRAYVSGQLDVEGSIFDALELRRNLPAIKLGARQWLALARRGPGRTVAAAPPGRRGAASGSPSLALARRRRDLAPLRRVKPVLRVGARPVDDVLVRGLAFA